MGITGLLPLLKKCSREAHLREFRGATAAVDAYCWLHKGAFSCADKLVRGEPTDGYVIYMMKQVNQLLNHDIKPILVFDGCHLPSKAGTEAKRRESREKNRKKAKEFLREGKIREARECYQRCVDVTSEMAAEVIAACRARGVDIIVAPYEADAQLAFLNLQGLADLIITEDSDLVLFGCKNIMFKVDNNGGGVLVEHEKLHSAMNMPRDKFTFDKFLNMCILSGCDYLPSLHGIGLAKAAKFFTVTSNPDVYNALCKLPSYLKMPHLEVTQEYREGFIKARNTFLYQLVFDPITRKLKPLTDYPEDKDAEDFPYAGKFIGHERALQIALGNVNVQNGETTDNFDPDTYTAPAQKSTDWSKKAIKTSQWSIWSGESFESKKTSGPGVPNIDGCNIETTKGKLVEVKVPNLKRRRHSDIKQQQTTDISEDDFQDLYGAPMKKTKSVTPDEDLVNNLDNLYEEKSEITNQIIDNDEHKPVASTLTTPKSCNPFAKCRSPSKSEILPAKKFSALKRFGQIKKTVLDNNTIVHSRYFSPPPVSQDHKTNQETPSPPEKSSLDALSQLLSDDENHEPTTPSPLKSPSKHGAKWEKSPFKSDTPLQSTSNEKKSFSWEKLSGFAYKKDKQIKVENSPASNFSFKSHSRISENISKAPSKFAFNSPLTSGTKTNVESPLESKETSLTDEDVKENTEEIQEDRVSEKQIKVERSPATNFFKSHSRISENISKAPSKFVFNSPLTTRPKTNIESPLEPKETSLTDEDIKENTEESQEDSKVNTQNSISSSQKSGLSSYSDVGSIDNESFNLSQESAKSEYFSSQKSAKKITPLHETSPNLERKPLQSSLKSMFQKDVTRQPVTRQPGLSRTALKKNSKSTTSKSKQLNLKDMFSKKEKPKIQI